MKYDPDKHHPTGTLRSRRSIRLKGYDYAQAGAYFVTICAQNRECLFGAIADGEMRMNEFGNIVQACWDDLPHHYPRVELDAFVVMPNHVHGIIVLGDTPVGAGLRPAPTTGPTTGPTIPANARRGLSEIVRAFKSFSSRRINELRDTQGTSVWQRNYYEHIIRNGADLDRIREYIFNNLANWANDDENPQRR